MPAKYLGGPYTSLNAVADNTNGTAINISSAEDVTVFFSYTLSGESPSVDLAVEVSYDNTNWYTVDSQTKTATGKHAVNLSGVAADYVRLVAANKAGTIDITGVVKTGATR